MHARKPGADRIAALEQEVASLRAAITLLHRIHTLVRSAIDVEATCAAVLTGVTAGVALGLNRAMIFLLADDRTRLVGAAAVGPADAAEADRIWRAIEAEAPDLDKLRAAGARRARPGGLDARVRATEVLAGGDSPIAIALRRAAPVVEAGTDDLDGLLHLPTSVAAPLHGRRGVIGVLYADNRFTGRRVDPVAQTVFGMVADHAGRAIESARKVEALKREASHDPLTGLGHRGALRGELARAVARGASRRRPVGLAMIDIDDFKRVNDTLGHLVGDAVLRGVADRMRGVVRARERLFRYGGEEFALVLPGADREAAARVGERLRRAVAAEPYDVGGAEPLRVTCSVGVASLPADGADAEALLGAADGALLRAKAHGKNRVEQT